MMPISTRFFRTADDPVIASRQIVLVNLAKELVSRPLVSILLAASCLCILALAVMILSAALVQYADILSGWLTSRASLLWSVVFLLCIASQAQSARRDIEVAQSGWLSALPQMPQAMQRWSRRRRWGLAMLESLLLVLAVVAVHRQAAAPGATLGAASWLSPLVVPALAALVAPGLARRGPRSDRSLSPPVRTASRVHGSARVFLHWQWAHYKSCWWRAGIRWSLGLLILLMPAGAAAIQVGIALLVGLTFLQLFQLWSSALHVIFHASKLVGALPSQPWTFVCQVSGLPLLIALGLPLTVGLSLAVLGVSPAGAVIAGLALFGAMTLNLATVLAWREESRFSGLRSVLVLLVWLALSQTAPLMAPIYWLVLIGWLVHRAGKGVS